MTPAQQIDALIARTRDWRGKTLAAVRKVILSADPGITEDWKWMGSPVWGHGGIIAVANPHKEKVKLTFANGAKLKDPAKLFNNGLGGNKWRSIDWLEGDHVDAAGLKALVREAIAYNQARAVKKKTPAKKAAKTRKAKPR